MTLNELGIELLRFAPLLLTILGWWLVNAQNNLREERKEHRVAIDTAKREIIRIADDAAAYRTDTMSKLGPTIKWSLEAVEIELERLPGFERESEAIEAFVNFSEACTGGDFEQLARRRLDLCSNEVREIAITRNFLLAALENRFRTRYPPEFDSYARKLLI